MYNAEMNELVLWVMLLLLICGVFVDSKTCVTRCRFGSETACGG
jgi:hypothetical protein